VDFERWIFIIFLSSPFIFLLAFEAWPVLLPLSVEEALIVIGLASVALSALQWQHSKSASVYIMK
jgi:hypothetical protein